MRKDFIMNIHVKALLILIIFISFIGHGIFLAIIFNNVFLSLAPFGEVFIWFSIRECYYLAQEY